MLIGALMMLLPFAAKAQALWQGTSYGMTPQEVLSVLKGAHPPSHSERLGNGASELLRLQDVQISNETFDAKFYFSQQRLVQVTLGLQRERDFSSAVRTFDSITEALRAKYGNEINKRSERGLMNRTSATWISGRTNIAVLCMSVGPNDAVLNINYQVRIAADADKL